MATFSDRSFYSATAPSQRLRRYHDCHLFRALFEMELALSAPTLISGGLVIMSLVLGSILIVVPIVVCIRNSFR